MKKVIFYTLTILFIILYTFFISGLMGLIGNHGIGKDGNAHIIHHFGSGLVLVFIISGLVMQFLGTNKKIAGFRLLGVTLIGLLMMAFIVGDPDNYGGNKAIFDLAFLIFIIPAALLWSIHPVRKDIFRLDKNPTNKPYLLLVLLTLIPLLIYGVNQSIVQRNSYPPLSDIHHNHWLAMATLAFTTILVSLMGAQRLKGHLIFMTTATLSLLLIGLISAINPNAASSYGLFFGTLSAIAGVATGFMVYREFTKLKQQKNAN